jgi:hypothetical protein
MGGHRVDVAPKPARNWGLLVFLVLCVEFWIVVTTTVAQNL